MNKSYVFKLQCEQSDTKLKNCLSSTKTSHSTLTCNVNKKLNSNITELKTENSECYDIHFNDSSNTSISHSIETKYKKTLSTLCNSEEKFDNDKSITIHNFFY